MALKIPQDPLMMLELAVISVQDEIVCHSPKAKKQSCFISALLSFGSIAQDQQASV